jgi:hypothetical protein
MIRQIAPRCPGSQDPEDAVEDTPVRLLEERHAAYSAAWA